MIRKRPIGDKSSGAAPTHRAKTSARNSIPPSNMPHSTASSMTSDADGSSETARESSGMISTPPSRVSTMPTLQRSDTVQQLGFILKHAQYGLVNWMLLFVPIAILVGSLTKPGPVVFMLNFLAILPLAASSILIVVIFTREMGIWGGMLRAIFGNTTELAVSLEKTCLLIYSRVLYSLLFLNFSSASPPLSTAYIDWCFKSPLAAR